MPEFHVALGNTLHVNRYVRRFFYLNLNMKGHFISHHTHMQQTPTYGLYLQDSPDCV